MTMACDMPQDPAALPGIAPGRQFASKKLKLSCKVVSDAVSTGSCDQGFCRQSTLLSLSLLLAAGWVLLFSAGERIPPGQALLPAMTRCDGPSDPRIDELARWAQRHGLPGVQIAHVDAQGQRLGCASGWSRFAPFPEPMRIDHRMRYASLSKLLTIALALRMEAAGRLHSQDRVTDLLGIDGEFADPRWREITVAQLMNHTAGFDRELGGDPMFAPDPWCPDRLDRLKTLRLDHPPGSRFAYSNVGYCLLGQVLVRTGGGPLQQLTEREILMPARASAIRPADAGRYADDEPGHFYEVPEDSRALLGMDYRVHLASGGWSGTATDFARWMRQLFGPAAARLPVTLVDAALAAPAGCAIDRWRGRHVAGFYRYREGASRTLFWRDGSMPGVTAFAALFENGEVVVVLANSRHVDWKPANDALGREIYRLFR